jgi:hypothetical protein
MKTYSLTKITIILLFLIVHVTAEITGQSTPKGTGLSQHIISNTPLTQSQINSINSYVSSTFPNAVKLEEPTSSYNCHNYAWVKSAGGGTFWLNTPGDEAFWNDGSYVSSTNTTSPNIRVSPEPPN